VTVCISRSFSLFVVTLPVDRTGRVASPRVAKKWIVYVVTGFAELFDRVNRQAMDQKELNHCQREMEF